MKSKMKYSIVEILISILMFLMLRPSFTWAWNMTLIQYFLFFLIAFQFDSKEKNNIALFCFLFVIISIVPIAHGSNILGIFATVLLAFVPFMRKDSSLRCFELFKFIIVAVMTVSIVVWFAVVVFQISLPYTVIEPLNELKEYNYMSYPFLLVPMSISDLALVRFCGVYDEPGVVGTLSLLLLFISDFNLKRFDNIVLLIAGIISFSLFFLIGFAVFLLIKVFVNKELKKYRMVSIAIVAALFVSALTIPVFNEMVGSRLEYDEDKGTIAGNNRSGDELDDYIVSIRGTDKYLWGDPKGEKEFDAHASFQNAILRYGMVFMVLFFIFYFLYAKSRFHNNWKEISLFMLLLFLTLYQRPGFLIPTYLFIFSCAAQVRQVFIEEKRKLHMYEKTVCSVP